MLGVFKSDSAQTLQKELIKDYINENKIQKLIDSGVNINRKDSKGRSILFSLISKRRIEAIKLLIKNGIDINSEDNFGKSVLSEAVFHEDAMMIRFLLENGASLNHINSSGRTILQDVALEGNNKIFKILLQFNPDLSLRDQYGKTVLFDAVEGGNLNLLIEILNNIDDINVVDNNGQSALFYALLNENIEISKYLVDFGLDVNISDSKRQNALFNGIILGSHNLEVIENMISKGLRLNQKDNRGQTVLDKILKILDLLKTSKEDSKKIEGKYRFANEERNYLKLTAILIDYGLAVNRIDDNGRTILYTEVKKKRYEIVDFLIQSGADINFEDKEGKTVLFDAILEGPSNTEMIDFLIEKGSDFEHRDYSEKTVVDDLIEIVLIQHNNKKASSRRHLDIKSNEDYLALLKKILLLKPKINIPRSDGRTLIFDIITSVNLELIKILFNAGIDPNIVDNDNNTPLSILVENGLKIEKTIEKEQFLERLVFLLKFRINLDLIDLDGRTVFHKAVIANDLTVVEKLLSRKTNLNIRDKQGRTALQHTQWKGNYKIARLLIAAGANMDEPDYAGFTLLNYAAILGHTRLVIVLIASGVLMYNRHKKTKAVAKYFKEKESNLEKLFNKSITDEKMLRAVQEVVENLKSEVAEALK